MPVRGLGDEPALHEPIGFARIREGDQVAEAGAPHTVSLGRQPQDADRHHQRIVMPLDEAGGEGVRVQIDLDDGRGGAELLGDTALCEPVADEFAFDPSGGVDERDHRPGGAGGLREPTVVIEHLLLPPHVDRRNPLKPMGRSRGGGSVNSPIVLRVSAGVTEAVRRG